VPHVQATILVVEDDRSNRELISKFLRQEGHVVVEASDGAKALEMLQALTFDLVITDFVLPKMNGIRFVEQLHTLQPRMPIILVTGYLSAISGNRLLEDTAEILTKPFQLNDLRSAVQRLLRKSVSC
jgi:adenylate cyclase